MKSILAYGINKFITKRKLNLGGGSHFCHTGWNNLESQSSRVNPDPFKFTPSCKFPFNEGSIDLVYSSHCFEHLTDLTLWNVLIESRRVMTDDGDMIIKLPDFDKILEKYKQGDKHFFRDELWGYGNKKWSWENKDMIDCLEVRAAILFCGFYNEQFGDPFSANYHQEYKKGAYCGSAVLSKWKLKEILLDTSPSIISKILVCKVILGENYSHLLHRNAWSLDEFRSLLRRYGFEIISTDKDRIIRQFPDIPGIDKPFDLERAMYIHVKKRNI